MYENQEYSCHFCGRRNHLSQNCRHKYAHLQQITRDKDGHFKKIYNNNIGRTSPSKHVTIEGRQERRHETRRHSSKARSTTPESNYNKTKRERSRTPAREKTPPKAENTRKIKFPSKEKSRQQIFDELTKPYINKNKTRERKRNEDDEITIIDEIQRLNKSKQTIPGLPLDTIKKGNEFHVPKMDKFITTKPQATSYLNCKQCMSWELKLMEENRIVKSLTQEVMTLRQERDNFRSLYNIYKNKSS